MGLGCPHCPLTEEAICRVSSTLCFPFAMFICGSVFGVGQLVAVVPQTAQLLLGRKLLPRNARTLFTPGSKPYKASLAAPIICADMELTLLLELLMLTSSPPNRLAAFTSCSKSLLCCSRTSSHRCGPATQPKLLKRMGLPPWGPGWGRLAYAARYHAAAFVS